jgi:hypothetical protein
MIVALPLTYVGDRVIESMSNQANNYQIGICNFSIMSAPLIIRVIVIVFNATSKTVFQLYRYGQKIQFVFAASLLSKQH